MATLKSKDGNRVILQELNVAMRFWARAKGLLGTSALPARHGLWIHRCNSVHTFFMKYTIDCIFLDAKMRVVSVVQNVAPGRMVWPQWGASSVVEIAGGQAGGLGLKMGDELYVGN